MIEAIGIMSSFQHLPDADAIMLVNSKVEAAIRDSSPSSLCPSYLSFLTSVYTVDGKLLPPNGKILSGMENIYGYWKDVLDAGITEIHLKTKELNVMNDTAIEVGAYLMKKGGVAVDEGKYVAIWKNEYGEWKYHRNIWNSNLAE